MKTTYEAYQEYQIDRELIINLESYYPSDFRDAVEIRQISEYELVIRLNDGTCVSYDDTNKTIRRLPSDSCDMSEMQFRREFALRLRRLMYRRGINQKQLSEKTGISETTLSHYLTERRTPNFYNVDKISKVLNCSVDDFRYFEF